MTDKKRLQRLAGLNSLNESVEDKTRQIVREYLNKMNVREEEDENLEGDEEGVEPEIEVPQGDPKQNVQDALTQAYESAKTLDDDTLLSQIGNTITYFTRNHVVKIDHEDEKQDITPDLDLTDEE